jgi:hypothetical protein
LFRNIAESINCQQDSIVRHSVFTWIKTQFRSGTYQINQLSGLRLFRNIWIHLNKVSVCYEKYQNQSIVRTQIVPEHLFSLDWLISLFPNNQNQSTVRTQIVPEHLFSLEWLISLFPNKSESFNCHRLFRTIYFHLSY